MDWYSWLSNAKLEPTTIYNYSILFADNELEEEDIAHFDHDFLQSMGVSIAKHRLEILKLSKKQISRRRRLLFVPPITKLLVGAFSKSKQRVARYFNTVVVGRDRSAIVAVAPSKKKGGAADTGMVRRKNNNRRVVVVKQARLLITNGGGGGGSKKNVDTSSMVGYGGGGGGGEEEVRWDCMFHDMKPT